MDGWTMDVTSPKANSEAMSGGKLDVAQDVLSEPLSEYATNKAKKGGEKEKIHWQLKTKNRDGGARQKKTFVHMIEHHLHTRNHSGGGGHRESESLQKKTISTRN